MTWNTESHNDFGIFYDLVNLFTVQNRLELGPQLPNHKILKSLCCPSEQLSLSAELLGFLAVPLLELSPSDMYVT